jgi:hypothetical protein
MDSRPDEENDFSINLPNPSGRTIPWGLEHSRCIGLTTLPSSVSQLSGHCGILNISQPYKPPQPVTGIVLLFTFHRIQQDHIV